MTTRTKSDVVSGFSRTSGFLKAGNLPTLVAALLYFDISFMVWVLLGPLAPFLREQFALTATQWLQSRAHHAAGDRPRHAARSAGPPRSRHRGVIRADGRYPAPVRHDLVAASTDGGHARPPNVSNHARRQFVSDSDLCHGLLGLAFGRGEL